ncbi:TPR-like protein [Rhizoclosmatium globosum]|uniref:TPR-like protein n=1 Tax=Rhizoclosmatium globosum TaxID=329046 RepID=A0A1Y2BV72_9FUNG|nr:TPR-like protein [Rhizoclosmatium globosum]|eukprot:ORY38633.1 TPR-like protein [Rhizoclosmatium globosum]
MASSNQPLSLARPRVRPPLTHNGDQQPPSPLTPFPSSRTYSLNWQDPRPRSTRKPDTPTPDFDLWSKYASNLASTGKLTQAEETYLSCIKQMRSCLGPDHEHTLLVMRTLADVYTRMRKYESAEQLYSECAERGRRSLGREHPATLEALAGVAEVYVATRRYEKAESVWMHLIPSMKKVFGESAEKTLVQMRRLETSTSLFNDGQHLLAEKSFLSLIDHMKLYFGANHERVLNASRTLAEMYVKTKNWERAEEVYSECAEVSRHKLGREHPTTLDALAGLAQVYISSERYENAVTVFQYLIPFMATTFGEVSPQTQAQVEKYYQAIGSIIRLDTAVSSTTTTVSESESEVPPPPDFQVWNQYSMGLMKNGDFTRAEDSFFACLTEMKVYLGPDNEDTLSVSRNLAGLYVQAKNWEKAEALYSDCLERSRRTRGNENPGALDAQAGIAEVYVATNRLEKAVAVWQHLIPSMARVFGAASDKTLTQMKGLARVYVALNQVAEADDVYSELLEVMRTADQKGEEFFTILKELAEVRIKNGQYEP